MQALAVEGTASQQAACRILVVEEKHWRPPGPSLVASLLVLPSIGPAQPRRAVRSLGHLSRSRRSPTAAGDMMLGECWDGKPAECRNCSCSISATCFASYVLGAYIYVCREHFFPGLCCVSNSMQTAGGEGRARREATPPRRDVSGSSRVRTCTPVSLLPHCVHG